MSQLHSCKTEVPFLTRTRVSDAVVLEHTQLPDVGRFVLLSASVMVVKGLPLRINLEDYHKSAKDTNEFCRLNKFILLMWENW